MSFSTSDAEIGFPLDRVPDAQLATLLKVSAKEVAARRKALAAQHADPAWIAEAVEALPAATLAVLHLVIDGGGIVLHDQLCRAARDRFGMSDEDCRAAAVPAIEQLLAVALTTAQGGVALGVVRPAAALVAPLVAGLDLLELPAAAFVASEHALRNARTFLAVCVATRHLDIKLTNEGRPHRSATKRLAKQVGIDETTLEDMLLSGLAAGLLEVEGEVLRPQHDALVEAAAGRYPSCPLIAAAQARLGRGPLPIHALLQSLLRRRDLSAAGYVGLDAFDYLPGFATGMVDGTRAVALRALDGVAAGHVTPSFEVMLPPEARLLDIVQVGACCDWDRLDRAIVGRITKASVLRAVAAGGSATELLAQLAAASRHPVPQNVEAAIRDWAGSVIAATIASGHVIVVDPAARDRVAPGLSGLGARELAPGVFVVERDDALRAIQTALARAGAMHREAPAARPALRPPAPEPVPAPPSPAAARVRARVSAWQRNESFEGKRDGFLDEQRRLSEAATAELRDVEQQLARWERRHGEALERDDPAFHALLAILGSLPAATRARLFVTSGDLQQLLGALSKMAPGRGAAARQPSRPQARRPARRPPPLLWQEDGLRERLQHAADEAIAFALQLPGGVHYVQIDSVLRRGQAWMVLGEDVTSGESVAVRLDDIRAIAALPDDLEAYDLGPSRSALPDDDEGYEEEEEDDDAPRARWQPAPGQAPPAGHLPCPCGSGARYRQCCRDIPRA